MSDKLHRAFATTTTDQGKTIEAGWLALRIAAIPPNAPDQQIREMRKAFFAGAQHLFASIMQMLEPGADPTEADLRRMSNIAEELEGWKASMRREAGL